MRDVSEIRRSREELERVATRDSLTGLANRTLFQDRLALAVARVRRSGGQGAILFMDLDRFKPINDTLGHHVGDELLQAVGDRLSGLCRAEDTVARFAGDEFTILLADLEEDTDAALVAEKVLDAFRTPFNCSGYEIEVTPSIGISVFPGDGERIDRLMQHADAAMYSAKEAGRNRYRFFTEELSQSATEYFALEQALRQALSQRALYLEYQPQYSLIDGQLCGIEALVRWQHPRRGLVPSQEFIHVAEHSGLIEQVGSLVLRKVCAQLASWREQGLDGLRVAVNLSPRQLADPDLVDEVRLIRQEFDLPASALELELTEHAVIRHHEAATRNLRGLAEQGISLAMDDFGTGHSSLVNLKRFPLNRVKIDLAFVRGLGQDRNDEAIVAAIVAMSGSLGLEVVAEGVERQEQLVYLQSIGCHQIQGYLSGRPMSPEALSKRLSVSRRIDVGRLANSA